jgi:hypothetical protein
LLYIGDKKNFRVFDPLVGLIKIPIPEMFFQMTVKGTFAPLPKRRVLRQ